MSTQPQPAPDGPTPLAAFDDPPASPAERVLSERGFGQAHAMVSGQVARAFDVIPLYVHENALYIGASKPRSDRKTADAIREIRKRNPVQVRVLKRSLEIDIIPRVEALYPIAIAVSVAEAGEADSIGFCDRLFREAVNLGASDVHVEWVTRTHGQILLFSQGSFQPYRLGIDAGFMRAIVGRMKVLANMDTGERNVPMDNRITVKTEDGAAGGVAEGAAEANGRVNMMPNVLGEMDVVVRILPGHGNIRDLDALGMPDAVFRRYVDAVDQPWGIVIVAGPVGAGKTTLAYATLKHLRSSNRHLASVEDPVETLIPYVRQVQVDPEVGRTFAKVVAGYMRRNVHCLLVGETRDDETAKSMVTASLTGVPSISTTHAINAAGVFPRFLELGVSPTSLSATMKFSLAQRIVRLLCQTCRLEQPGVPEEFRRFAEGGGPVYARNPEGCDDCASEGEHRGFFGRAAIFEGISVSERIRGMIARAAGAHEIIRAAVLDGTEPMQVHGYRRVFAGETSFEEIDRTAGRIDPSIWGKEFAK